MDARYRTQLSDKRVSTPPFAVDSPITAWPVVFVIYNHNIITTYYPQIIYDILQLHSVANPIFDYSILIKNTSCSIRTGHMWDIVGGTKKSSSNDWISNVCFKKLCTQFNLPHGDPLRRLYDRWRCLRPDRNVLKHNIIRLVENSKTLVTNVNMCFRPTRTLCWTVTVHNGIYMFESKNYFAPRLLLWF